MDSAERDYLVSFLIVKILAILGLVVLAAVLPGCASIPATGSKIAPPAPELMSAPAAFPSIKSNQDARVVLVDAAAIHAREARRIKRLQRYVKEVRQD
jgi:hypothetical protein